MPTAEELLNQAAESGAVGSNTKTYLTVDLESRQIIIPGTIRNIGVESDDEVKRLYFKIPRYYDEIDLFEAFRVRINYVNAEGEEDVYKPEDVTLDGDYITFSWLIGRFAVTKEGAVKFNVCMIKYQEDGITIDQEFNATPTSLPVLKGLECSGAVYEKERDALAGVSEDAAEAAYVRALADAKKEDAKTLKSAKAYTDEHSYSKTETDNKYAGACKATKTGIRWVSVDDADDTTHDIYIKVTKNTQYEGGPGFADFVLHVESLDGDNVKEYPLSDEGEYGETTFSKPFNNFSVSYGYDDSFNVEVTYNKSIASCMDEFERAIDATIALCDAYIGGEVE